MRSAKTIFLAIFLAGSTLLVGLLPYLPLPEEAGTGLLVLFGRFHPLLLHFPIVLVLLTLIFEGLNIYSGGKSKTGATTSIAVLIGPLLMVSLLSALITVIGGYLLFRSGEYQGALVNDHLWGGVWLILVLNGAALFYWRSRVIERKWSRLFYRLLLLARGALIIYTSHLGGSITHGQDFLTEHLPSYQSELPTPIEEKNQEELLVFEDLILPVFEDKCQSCHNQYKVKGGLQMTSYSDLQKGGDSEKPLLVAHLPAESELHHRINLPVEDDDHMPPPEKEQLNNDEIALIQWWIQSGASEEMLLGADPPDSISALMERFLPNLFRTQRLKMRQLAELDDLEEELAAFGEPLGLVIKIDPEYLGFFGVSMQMPPSKVDNNTVGELMPYANLISKLSLPGAEIDDDALYDIGKMSSLRSLFLPKTCVTGDGLVYLNKLPLLECINLSHSCLTNDGILNLIQLPRIDKIYVFGADTDTTVLQAMRKHLPKMKILEEEGPYY